MHQVQILFGLTQICSFYIFGERVFWDSDGVHLKSFSIGILGGKYLDSVPSRHTIFAIYHSPILNCHLQSADPHPQCVCGSNYFIYLNRNFYHL